MKALTEEQEPVNILYYGDGGTAKTTHLAHMAKGGKILVVNAEGGFKARALRQFGVPIENIVIFPDPNDENEEISYDGLIELWQRIREELNADPEAWYGVVWDSISEIYMSLLMAAAQQGWYKAQRQGKERDKSFIALEDYGVMTTQVRSLFRKFRDLPCHFGVSALSKREQDDDGTVVFNPQITAKLQTDLVGWVDIVCVTKVSTRTDGEEEFVGLFRPMGKYRGKDRFKVLPKGLVDPQFDRILDYVDGHLTVDTDPVMLAAKARADAEKEQEEAVPA